MRFLHEAPMTKPTCIANIKVDFLSLKKTSKSDSFYIFSLNRE